MNRRPILNRFGDLIFLALVLTSACSRKGPDGLVKTAVQAEAEAKAAFEKGDVRAADLAMAKAEEATQQLKKMAEANELTGQKREQLLPAALAAKLSAANFAQLAHEDKQRREVLGSFKLTAYQRVRSAVLSFGLAGPAFAAEQLGRSSENSSNDMAFGALAARLWRMGQPTSAVTNIGPDWTAIAADLRSWSSNPPPELGMFLALTFAVSGWTDFALSEIDSVDVSRLAATNTRSIFHLQRCALLAVHGWDRSAGREMDQAVALSPEGWPELGRTQALALFHFWLAEHAIRRGNHEQANAELAQANKGWPESPFALLINAEQLAANGQWSKAAELLENRASSALDPWLAERFNQRARQFRNMKMAAPPLLDEPSVLFEFIGHSMSESAQNSLAAQKLRQCLDDSKVFGLRLLDKLPGLIGGAQSASSGR
jgi:hypothetical protein